AADACPLVVTATDEHVAAKCLRRVHGHHDRRRACARHWPAVQRSRTRIRPAVATGHICRVEAARPSVQPEPQPQPPVATAPAREAAPAWQVWTALWIVYVVWGSTYLAIRVADRTLPALLTSGARFLLA